MTKILTNILIVVIVFTALFYSYQFWKDRQTEPLLTIQQEDLLSEEIGNDLLFTLLKLGSLELDESIFKDSLFKKLVDFSVKLKAQPVGRLNPFSPIGSDESRESPPADSEGEGEQ
jgi:hypothetical protein